MPAANGPGGAAVLRTTDLNRGFGVVPLIYRFITAYVALPGRARGPFPSRDWDGTEPLSLVSRTDLVVGTRPIR